MDGATAIARLRELAACGQAGRWLLSRLPCEAPGTGLTVQAPPIAAAPAASDELPVAYGSNAKKGQTLAILLAHFAAHPKPQTVDQLAAVTKLNVGTLYRVVKTSGRFERQPGWRGGYCLKPIPQGGSHACA
jgi:hypothetical protein